MGELEKELKYITSLKEKYVKDHPEAKDQVFKPRGGQRPGDQERPDDGEDGPAVGSSRGRDGDPMGHLYDPRTGTLRDPKRSVYYDPTYNPFGAPPPGMPYRERSKWSQVAGVLLTAVGVEDESDDDDDESDDGIVMPEGPPPDADSEGDSDDSDDIPLPAGPPPPKLPPPSAPVHHAGYTGFATPMHARPPPIYHSRPPPTHSRPPPGSLPARPPAPQSGPHGLPPRPPSSSGTNGTGGIISAEPSISRPTAAPPSATATISAEPQMRDLRKEATVFVPRGIKRKKGSSTVVNATPGGGEVDEDGDSVRVKRDDGPGLLGKLQSVLGDAPRAASTLPTTRGAAPGGDDDYQNFLKGLGDLS